jgi:hypothetical protein
MVDSPHVPDVIGQVVSNRTSGAGAVVTAPLTERRCLNCGAALTGAFCGACGQRSVPANPTVSELAGDAWQELSGYDGRIAATFRGLLHPGRLTVDYLQGRRARYLSPVRLYLTVSVIYFLIAAAAPQIAGGLRIGFTNTERNGSQMLTEQDRAEMLKDLGGVPWVARPMVRSIAEDPDAFRARLFAIMPRVFFGMLPVFAAIVALFYRSRRFPAALVFAVHVHAFAFLIFSLSEAAKFSGSATVANIVGLIAAIVFTVYAPLAQKQVFGGSWPAIIAKSAGIGFLYLLVSVPAFLIILIWASLV